MRKLGIHTIIGMFLAFAPLTAQEEAAEAAEGEGQVVIMTDEEQEAVKESRLALGKQHAAAGMRALSHGERVAIQEERAQQEKDLGFSTTGTTAAAQKSVKALAAPKAAAFYTTSHPGAIHYPVAVSFTGDLIELEDGSVWAVRPCDAYKTLNWILGDTVFILPNDWFSIYSYRIVNQQTGAVVDVNLSQGPIYNCVYTHWIVGIDYWNEEIWLEDGSRWTITAFDYSTFKKWALNDTVIIGINDDYMSTTRPNILINVNMLNYCRANCCFKP